MYMYVINMFVKELKCVAFRRMMRLWCIVPDGLDNQFVNP